MLRIEKTYSINTYFVLKGKPLVEVGVQKFGILEVLGNTRKYAEVRRCQRTFLSYLKHKIY